MTPETDHILLNAIGTLATGIGPEVTTPFGQGQLGLVSALLYFSALDYESAADIRTGENRQLRTLFADAALADIGLNDELRGVLQAAGKGGDPDLKISTLNAANHELKSLLIRLHEHLEKQEGGAARTLETRVWQVLRASAESRALVLPELG